MLWWSLPLLPHWASGLCWPWHVLHANAPNLLPLCHFTLHSLSPGYRLILAWYLGCCPGCTVPGSQQLHRAYLYSKTLQKETQILLHTCQSTQMPSAVLTVLGGNAMDKKPLDRRENGIANEGFWHGFIRWKIKTIPQACWFSPNFSIFILLFYCGKAVWCLHWKFRTHCYFQPQNIDTFKFYFSWCSYISAYPIPSLHSVTPRWLLPMVPWHQAREKNENTQVWECPQQRTACRGNLQDIMGVLEQNRRGWWRWQSTGEWWRALDRSNRGHLM